jgi:carbonic anhydrase/SulP family sulfate permease
MSTAVESRPGNAVAKDLTAGLIVFLVALPLCLGIALASGASAFSGLVAGIVGGIVVGVLSGSHTSVSGPAAGLTAIVFAQIKQLGAFDTFLLAVLLAGLLQVAMGLFRAGALSAFVPSSVIKGLLAAIGVILILKQIPHLVGYDVDPEGDMAFVQPNRETTFSTLYKLFTNLDDVHAGATLVGLLAVGLLLAWDRIKPLKKSVVPGPLIAVLLGVGLAFLLDRLGGKWVINGSHRVDVPIANNAAHFLSFLRFPDFAQIANPAVYLAAVTIAIVASLETLLNLEAVDKLDPRKRHSPPNRELLAQGAGNAVCGLLGGLPVTSVIVRSSVNLNAGAHSKRSTVFHGILLLVCVALLPTVLNLIPLAALAAILIVTGFKLASPKLFKQMWAEGVYQFAPFIITLVAIVLTDLLIGILIGLGVSVLFILNSNLRRPVQRTIEKHLGGDVLHIELANQVSFLNRAALEKVLREAPSGSHILLDASRTDYIDPDVLHLIREFKDEVATMHGVQVSTVGFREHYKLEDKIEFVDYSTRELQEKLRPEQVLQILREGNERFRSGKRLRRDLNRQVNATAAGQHPLAVVLSCIDSRTPSELIFDLGLGDIFSVRMAGNVTSPRVLGSMEYGTAVAGAKLILVVGHTRCGAVTASVMMSASGSSVAEATGCQNLEPLVQDIQQSIDPTESRHFAHAPPEEKNRYVDAVARKNVLNSVRQILEQSSTIRHLVESGAIAVVGAMYDVHTGGIDFLEHDSIGLCRELLKQEAALV